MNHLQQGITSITGNVFHSTIFGKNYTFKKWLASEMQSAFDSRYRTFLIIQTHLDKTKTLYQLNPESPN
jgi:hypothetical protein